MSIKTWPGFGVSSFRWTKAEQQIPFKSVFGSQALVVASPLWRVDMVGSSEKWDRARAIETYLESLEGFKNQVELWNIKQPVPAGTMRGTMVLSADAAQSARSLSISAGSGQAGKTLLAGDLIGLGSGVTQQVVRVTANAVADGSGVIEVTIGTPLRNAFLAGADVTWDKPKALFRVTDQPPGLEHVRGASNPWSLSLLENWLP